MNQFIEIQIYLTGRLSDADIGNIMMNDDGNVVDTITGLRAPTHYGRPDWDRIFSNMRDLYPATDIGVFFCGPKPLGKALHTKSNLWSQGFEGVTRFYYGKGMYLIAACSSPSAWHKNLRSNLLITFLYRKLLETKRRTQTLFTRRLMNKHGCVGLVYNIFT